METVLDDKYTLQESFSWMLTNFIIFELENNYKTVSMNLSNSESVIENLIKFHESHENYEICRKILDYKNRMKYV